MTSPGLLTLDDAKPCPFCGYQELEFVYNGAEDEFVFVSCKDCQGQGPIHDTEAGSISRWNWRK